MRALSVLVLLVASACSAAVPRPDSATATADARPALGPDAVVPPFGAPPPGAAPSELVLTNARLAGGAEATLYVSAGRLVDATGVGDDAMQIDAGGAYVVPAFIDSHVHFAYLPAEEAHAAGGVAAAVDLASPMHFLDADVGALRLARAGPMITATNGYPTRSWGSDGYGYECDSEATCVEAVADLASRGVDLIKVPLTEEPTLDDAALSAVVSAAHGRDLLVAAHALTDASARRAADAGVDILAHTPVAPLSDETVTRLGSTIVISTLSAFGGSPDAVDNLARLRRAGATVLYGTDLGNTRSPGIDARELSLLAAAGLDEAAILDAATGTPARVFGFDGLGTLETGAAASFLLVGGDPLLDVGVVASPLAVFIDGQRRR